MCDIDGDGRVDVVSGGFMDKVVHWYKNPGPVDLDRGRLWPKQVLMDTGALQRVFKDRSRRQGISEAEVKKQMAASVPAKRLGTADDFGPVCAFLCSRLTGYITGQNICVDGGLVKSLI